MALIREASRANRRRSVRGAVRAEEQLKLPSIANQLNWRAFQGLTKSCSQHEVQPLRYLLACRDLCSEIHIEVISPRNDLIAVKLKYAHYLGCSDLAAIHSDLSGRDKLIRLAAYVPTTLSEPSFWARLAQTALFEGKDYLLRLELEKIYSGATLADQRAIRACPDSDILLQLKEYSYILGANFLMQKLNGVINCLKNMEYRCFEGLIVGDVEWVVRPTENYDWFTSKLASNFSSKVDIVGSH